MECLTCGGGLPVREGRGRRPKFCSDACRFRFRDAARVLDKACKVCTRPVPVRQARRVYCGSPQCKSAVQYMRDLLKNRDMVEVWDRFFLSTGVDGSGGFQEDRPVEKSRLVRRPNGEGDLDPWLFDDGSWDVHAFVSEFGVAGAEVGQTYPLAGVTLGAGCGNY